MKDISGFMPLKLKPPFRHVRGTGYAARLPEEFRQFANHGDNAYNSPLRLKENGVFLSLPYAMSISILYSGGGAYNHWGDEIIFASSDSSDPNSNGREYSLELARGVDDASGKQPLPQKVHVTLSVNCNLHCRICRPEPITDSAPMDMRMFDKIAEQIFPTAELRLDSGGELLLNRNLSAILKKVTDLRQPFFTSTNGMLLTPEKAHMLAESSLYHIQISLDSPQKETLEWIRRGANFERIVTGVKNLVAARKEVGRPFLITFHAAIMRHNVRHMPDLVRLAHTLGIEGVTANHLFVHACFDPDESCYWEQGLFDEMREKAIETARSLNSFFYGPGSFSDLADAPRPQKGAYCPYPHNGTYIEMDGSVHPCCVAPQLTLGSLADSSFEDIWNGEKYQKLRSTYRDENPFYPKCKECLVMTGSTPTWQSWFDSSHWDKVKARLEA